MKSENKPLIAIFAWLWVAGVLAAYLYQFRDIITLIFRKVFSL